MSSPVLFSLMTVYLVWGSTYLGMKFALMGGFTPYTQSGIRFLLAGLLLFGFLYWRKFPLPNKQQWLGALYISILMIPMGHSFVLLAEESVSSSLAAVCIGASPLWAAIWNGFWGIKPKPRELVALSIGFVGIVVLNLGQEMQATPLALILLIVSPMAWSFGTVWSKHLSLPKGMMSNATQMILGGLVCFGIAFLRGEQAHPTVQGTWAMVYLLIFGSLLAYSAFTYLVQNVPSSLALSYAYVNPVVALALGSWLNHEKLSPQSWVATLIILLAVVLITLPETKRVN